MSEEIEVQEVEKEPEANPQEDKARKMGWVPKEEFKGDPDKWRPADEFVERGENYIPILKSTVEKQNRQLAELQKTIKEFGEYHSKSEERAYKRALAEIEKRQEAAVEVGDKEAFAQAKAEMKALEKEIAEVPKVPTSKDAGTTPAEEAAYEEWSAKNKWFTKDKDMTIYANSISEFVRSKGLPYEDFLEEVTNRVKKEFPEKFENPRRTAAPSVEGGSTAPRKGGKGFQDLPAEAKAAYDRFQKQGLKITKEEYVKNYEWE